MRAGPAGQPALDPTARTLGVRPGIDLAIDNGDAWIDPDVATPRGLSVDPDSPAFLLRHRRPNWLAVGTDNDPLFVTTVERIEAAAPTLVFHQDGPTHGVIAPRNAMPLSDYQAALAATRDSWFQITEP